MASNDTNGLLSAALDSPPFLLAYTIPLLIISFIIAFAGTFLTIDRTRTFAPVAELNGSTPSSNKLNPFPRNFYLFFEGGIGGIATGFAFGVHASTFLSLLIPSVTSSAPLGVKSFTATWLLSSVVTAVIAGRWKYAAFIIAGLSGYTTFALALSVMLHPNLITRIAVTATITVVGTVLCLIPLPRLVDFPLRFATSATGAFGIVLCIALMGHIPAWANVWDRYWISDSLEWGTSKEKGLSAVYSIILALGILCDALLHRKFGENPDEKWDRYLADYSTHLPTERDRAGSFQPPASIWERILASTHGFQPANSTMPGDIEIDLKRPPPDYSPGKLYRNRPSTEKVTLPDLSTPPPRGAFLRRDRKHKPSRLFGGRSRGGIRFNTDHDDLMDSEEEDASTLKVTHEEDIAASFMQSKHFDVTPPLQLPSANQQGMPPTQVPSERASFWRDVKVAAEGKH